MMKFVNSFIEQVANAVDLILLLLPDSPFKWAIISDLVNHPIWSNVNYFIPFDVLASIMLTYVSSVLIWYALRWLLRFVQFIQ